MNDNNFYHLNCVAIEHSIPILCTAQYIRANKFRLVNIPKTIEALNGRRNEQEKEEEEEIIIMGLNESELTMPKYQAIYVIVRKFVI